jgi:hypothetical protein
MTTLFDSLLRALRRSAVYSRDDAVPPAFNVVLQRPKRGLWFLV